MSEEHLDPVAWGRGPLAASAETPEKAEKLTHLALLWQIVLACMVFRIPESRFA
jgi:hypothetical protein